MSSDKTAKDILKDIGNMFQAEVIKAHQDALVWGQGYLKIDNQGYIRYASLQQVAEALQLAKENKQDV